MSIKDGTCKINPRHPEHYTDPKKPLNEFFYKHLHRGYEDRRDAEKIIKLADISKLERCSSFVRFANKIR